MKITFTALKLGAVSTVLIVVTAFIMVVFGQIRFDRTVGYSAIFSNASGLREGQFVRASGVEIGKVSRIRLAGNQPGVRVDFTVERSLPLYEGTEAMIRYASLTGDRYLELKHGATNGTGALLPPGGTIPVQRTQPALDLDALIGGFKPLFRAMDPGKVNTIANSLITIFQDQGGTINDILDQTAELTSALADHDRTIGEVVDNLNTLLATTVAHRTDFDHAITDFEALITGLRAQADPLADATERIGNVSGTLADLLSEVRPTLRREITAVQAIQQPLADQQGRQLNDLLTKLPAALKIIGRSGGIYGDFFNFYICDLNLKLNGLQPGGPVRNVRLTSQPSGRCTPR